MKKGLVFLFFVGWGLQGAGQVTWQKAIGVNGYGVDAYCMIHTRDNGFAFCGNSGAGFYIAKVDSNINIEWSKIYSISSINQGFAATSITQDVDGGYSIVGWIFFVLNNNFNMQFMKFDSLGNLISYKYMWSLWQSIGGSAYGFSIINMDDGGDMILGGDYGFSLIKLDANQNIQWSKSIGDAIGVGADPYHGGTIFIKTLDGGYAICGSRNHDACVIKTDSSGNVQWAKTIGDTTIEQFRSIVQTIDGGYALCGDVTYYSSTSDIYVAKIDSVGNLLWTKTIGGTTGHNFGTNIIQNTNGDLTLSAKAGVNWNDYIVKLDSYGNMLWGKSISISGGGEPFSSLICNSSNEYFLASNKTVGGFGKIWLIKLDNNGNTCGAVDSLVNTGSLGIENSFVLIDTITRTFINNTTTLQGANPTLSTLCSTVNIELNEYDSNSFSIYPNPTVSTFTIILPNQSINSQLTIYDVTGRLVHEQGIRNQESEIINCHLAAGIYLVKVRDGEKVFTQKLVVE